RAESLLRESGVGNDGSPLIVIQVGASHPSKRWDEESFGQTARMLQESIGATTVFCGVPIEMPLVETAMRSAGTKAINLVGQTDIPVLAAILARVKLVISNDTGTMHLAQAVGTPVLCLTTGNALSQETGPYGENNLVVEPQLACYPCDFQVQCPHFNCRQSFSPTLVAKLAVDMLENAIPDHYEIEDASVIISRTGFDENGFWHLKRLAGPVNRMDSLRNRYRSILSERFGVVNETEVETARTVELSEQDRAISIRLRDVAMRGEHSCVTLLNLLQADPDPENTSALAGQIDDLQDQVLNGFLQAEFLHPLLALFRFELENLSDSDAVKQITGTQAAFQRLATSVALLTQGNDVNDYQSALSNEPIETRELLEASPPETNPPSLYDRFRRPRFRSERLTVILLESDYYLQCEIRAALLRMGHRVMSIRYLESGNVIEQLLLASMEADLLITVNHLGFDEDGELAALLEKIELPYVSWFADRPQYILLDHNAAAGEMAHLFTWERLTIPELIGYGFERVEYLPLATDETAFASHSTKNEPLRGPCWVANSMVEPVIEWERRANVRSAHQPVLSMAIEDLLDARCDPWDALNEAIKQYPVLTQDWTHGDKLRMATLVAFRATREDRKRIVQICQPLGLEITGDEGWMELFPDLKLNEPIHYGPELAAYYANSIQLNSTSYQMPSSVNQRVFDVPCAGGILLTDEQSDIHELFDSETECITYRTPEE
ncbi:MAG TPA: hypothetical protein ENH10_07360, partial [Bacteroidetes bacterium]|nr:hypothetical protein [Bacteroidota bacterium]HEX04955.1 hypothetical protein [Bacteroidota bacterium]